MEKTNTNEDLKYVAPEVEEIVFISCTIMESTGHNWGENDL